MGHRRPHLKRLAGILSCCVVVVLGTAIGLRAAEAEDAEALQPGTQVRLTFPDADLPPTLYSSLNKTAVPACLTFRLPDDYSPAGLFPLVVYVPGNDGGLAGNIHNAESLAGPRGWIAATLPLFKKDIDRSGPAGGVHVSYEDYPVLSKAYQTMLGRLFERIPNIDREQSAMVGYSNGAIAIGVLVSNHDEFVLTHFRSYCMVDQGMFHLADLHKSRTRDCRFLLLVGGREGFGREVKIRQSRLLQDSWELLGVNLTYRVLEDSGHEFGEREMAVVRTWLQESAAFSK